jgi:hypothetical protein
MALGVGHRQAQQKTPNAPSWLKGATSGVAQATFGVA